jgi:asparagine synthase (glutamine-hydrolysing)
LAINGVGAVGRQPFRYGNFIGAFNGEVYNHRELEYKYSLSPSECDTEVILPLFQRQGPRVIDQLDGFFAGLAFQLGSRDVFCFRDHIGKKPLFFGRSRTEFFISSELKTFDSIDWFEPLPRGVSRVNLDTGSVATLAAHYIQPVTDNIVDVFDRSVRKRIPQSDQPVGVFLSGGLDSSLIASFVCRLRDDATYFTLGDEDGTDRQAVKAVVNSLGLKDVRVVPLPPAEQMQELLKSVVYATESFNPSIVSNGLATYMLAKAAHEAEIKVILTGEGADELFGGYHLFREGDKWRETRDQLISDMQTTELRRLDMTCMAHSVEARCPFLDRGIRGLSDCLGFHGLYDHGDNKVTLRRSFKGMLPDEVLQRRKVSFDVGSGIRGKVVRYLRRNGKSEKDELREIWHQYFRYDLLHPYFYAYPVFDTLIDRRGEAHR